jgi:hypothetical protein
MLVKSKLDHGAPYKIIKCDLGYCIEDCAGFNVLRFTEKPGACFTDNLTSVVKSCKEWNNA